MIFKALGGKKASIDYQLKNPTANVLRGDPEKMRQLIETSPFAQKYCGMVLSFEEEIAPEVEGEILDSLIKVIRGGLEDDALAILVVRHTDKQHPDTGNVRPDYHITTLETDLYSGKHMTLYKGKRLGGEDHDLFYSWERLVNHQYGFGRPDDPSRRRTINIPKKIGKDQKELLVTIDRMMLDEAKAGRIKNRADVILFFEQAGFSVPRQGRDYITIEDKDKKRTRLKGLFYESGFTVEGLATGATRTGRSPDWRSHEKLGDLENRFSGHLSRRVERFQKLYRRDRKKIATSALAGADRDGVGRVVQRVLDADQRLEISANAGQPRPLREFETTKSDSHRPAADFAGAHLHRNRKEELSHEKHSAGIDAASYARIGRCSARSRTTAERTAEVLSATTAAMGAKSGEFDQANSGLATAIADFVQVVAAFDRAIKFARSPLGLLARFVMAKNRRRRVRPPRWAQKFTPPSIK
jgi:hypothetical protein